MKLKRNSLPYLIVVLCVLIFIQPIKGQTIPRKKLIFYTQKWHGSRFPDGRPKVPDNILKQMKYVTVTEAWGILRSKDYYNQYEGNWKILHPDRPIIGRALTAQYMPSRPDMQKPMVKRGHKNGRSGAMNSWPIDALHEGDVYVADGYGKVKNGTLIGGRLGNTIYDNSGKGVIFNGSVRDLEELENIKGFNAFIRAWHPSYLINMMLTGLDTPIRIGHATVLPGDVVLAKKEGVVFIPAYLAATVVKISETTRLTDAFAFKREKQGTYTAGQMDSGWTKAIRKDFFHWLKKNESSLQKKYHVPQKRIAKILKTRKIH
jgi:regulator of RNase E activity RraA